MPKYPLFIISACVALCACTSDEGTPDQPGFPNVPAGMTALRITPSAPPSGRGSSSVATTANLRDFDFVLEIEGSSSMKGRYDVATGCLYSTNTGVLTSQPIYVPTGSAFTLRGVAAGRTIGNDFVAMGSLLDYSPLATGTKDLSSGGVVLDYIQGQSARMVASGGTLSVPLTFSHLTSQITLSAQVKGDYIVRLDRRLLWTGNVRRWGISYDGQISCDASDKTHTRKYLLPASAAADPKVSGTPISAFAGEYSTLLLTEASGKTPLNYTGWDNSITTWGSDYEPSNAIFVWPGAYSSPQAPFVNSGTFAGGSALVLNFQARACEVDASGNRTESGADIIPSLPSVSNSLGDADGTQIGRCSVFIPLDFSGSKALAAGRCYNLNIVFGSGSWGFDPHGDPCNFPISLTCEQDDWRLPPGIDASITGDGWTGNSMPNDNLR